MNAIQRMLRAAPPAPVPTPSKVSPRTIVATGATALATVVAASAISAATSAARRRAESR